MAFPLGSALLCSLNRLGQEAVRLQNMAEDCRAVTAGLCQGGTCSQHLTSLLGRVKFLAANLDDCPRAAAWEREVL